MYFVKSFNIIKIRLVYTYTYVYKQVEYKY